MRPLLSDPLHAAIFAAVFLWAFVPEFRLVNTARRAVKESPGQDKGSVEWIARLGGVAMLIGIVAMAFLRRFGFTTHRETWYWIGILMLVGGSLLRRLCWRTLGRYFTGNVTASSDQRVVDTGPYRLVRHPSYTAGVIMNAGIGLAMGNWISLGALVILSLVAYAYRISVEERALAGAIGQPYVDYMRRTKRLVPWVV